MWCLYNTLIHFKFQNFATIQMNEISMSLTSYFVVEVKVKEFTKRYLSKLCCEK
jgi:hypothetical protein